MSTNLPQEEISVCPVCGSTNVVTIKGFYDPDTQTIGCQDCWEVWVERLVF